MGNHLRESTPKCKFATGVDSARNVEAIRSSSTSL